MPVYCKPIETLIDEFRALLICKDKASIESYWNGHSLLRAWYRGGCVNFGSREGVDWRTLSFEDCINDCGLALYSGSDVVYQQMRTNSDVLRSYLVDDIDNEIQDACFKQALINRDGEEIYIIVDKDPDFFSRYLTDNKLSMFEKLDMLKMLLLSDPRDEALLSFWEVSEISCKAFNAYMRTVIMSKEDILKCFNNAITNGLHQAASEILFGNLQLAKAIGKLSAANIIYLFTKIANSNLGNNTDFVDGFIGLVKNSNYRDLAVAELEKNNNLLLGKNNPVLITLKALQQFIYNNVENQTPIPENTKKRKRTGIFNSMFEPPAEKKVTTIASRSNDGMKMILRRGGPQ
ncbi:MAG: hypothetical protein WAW86_07925 [Gammaproteobacteria bacterium]